MVGRYHHHIHVGVATGRPVQIGNLTDLLLFLDFGGTFFTRLLLALALLQESLRHKNLILSRNGPGSRRNYEVSIVDS